MSSDALTRLSSALDDRYRVERELGQGGMATVYLAEDLKHGRKVAIKVLHPELSAIIGGERFLAEIKVTANLQHPHILGLIDSGTADGLLYYVMPFIAGETLRARLSRERQLPVEDALRLTKEVAGALDYAHRQGVVHRDIKPENILLQDGSALVADFGIALAVAEAGGSRMTQTGMSLGTPAYMSPEQAMGERDIGARSDVYALGAMAYEMLAGEPPFTGPNSQAIMAKVLTEPPISLRAKRPTVPASAEAAILTALQKLPADRFTSAAAFSDALGQSTISRSDVRTIAMPSLPSTRPRARLRDPVVLGLTAALAVTSVVSIGLVARERARPPELRPIRFLYGGTDSAPATPVAPWGASMSPDGSALVFGVRKGGARVLFLRRTDQLEPRPIPGTESANQPVFSPDGMWIAFESNNKEKKVRLDGSAPVTIADGGFVNGSDWTVKDELVVGATGKSHGLSHVSVAGGSLVPFTHPDSARGELDHLWPIACPDGRSIVFISWTGALATAELALTTLDEGAVTPLHLRGVRPLAVVDGELVYVQADGAVMAVKLDVAGRKVDGQPVPVHDPVQVELGLNGNSGIYVSRGGALVSSETLLKGRLTWVGRDATYRALSSDVRTYLAPRVSPNGRRIAVMVQTDGSTDVWIDDLDTKTFSRLTSVGTVGSAEWSKDGRRIVYVAAMDGGSTAVWAQDVDAASAPAKLAEVQLLGSADIAPDGRSLLVSSLQGNVWSLLRVALDSPVTVTPYSNTSGQELMPRISPDGHWAANTSDASGTTEVYVRSYPDPSLRVQVSVGGGGAPAWSADGSTLYYVSGNAVMAAKLATSTGVRVVARDTAFANVSLANNGGTNFDVTRDGSRMIIPVVPSLGYQLVVAPNWRTELHERLAASRK